MSEDLREHIKAALAEFARPNVSLRSAALQFFAKLGYQSDRTVEIPKSDPNAFLDLFAKDSKFDPARALFPDWKSVDLLFQLTDQEIRRELSLFPETSIQRSQLKSYVFIGIELTGKSSINGNYARGKLTALARQINRIFPMPVMVLMKHLADRRPVVSIAVINRRRNKIHEDKDVMEKTTIIRDISITDPHRGHLDILASFAFENLVHPQRFPINNFDALHAAWEEIFNVELLNKRFYKELSNWYFWALDQVEFPSDLEPDRDKRNATGLIRLLTRLIFCWFLKEKDGLIPDKLFHPSDLAMLLNGFDPESETSSTYYLAILQNLFFATLNQRMGKDGSGKPYRFFAKDEGFQKNRATYDVNNLHRYEKLFAVSEDEALAIFADIPFLNGGLFECLDRTEDGTDKKRYLDGFSRNAEKRPHIPDRLFFDSGETADLSKVYGDKKRKAERVTGLITILNRYKFTIVENTPIDQEIALDPELLGKVFENLLASYNEETKTTARKQTGSFYTPRPIVDYMVDESLKAHLTRSLVEKARMKESDAKAGLDILFAYTEKEHAFNSSEVDALIAAIDEVKILDPACGSGAFPMGVLHKLVYILGKLDPDNERWKQTQLAKLDSAPMREELERAFADNNDDYGRKLYLIENCLYGVDIQPIAIQITKLRFFISLVCDQKTNRDKSKNHGIRPLPNLETKFVAADTLIGLPEMTQSLLVDPRVDLIEKEIESLYHSHFSIHRRDQKLALQRKIKTLRHELGNLLAESLMAPKKAQHVADWDPFHPQSIADFFDPHWMFGRSLADGFDVVIGNPPFISYYSNTGNTLDESKRAYFVEHFESVKKPNDRINSMNLFAEKGLRLLKAGGHQSLITNKTLAVLPSYIALRDYLLKNSVINYFATNLDPFEAIVDCVVFGVTKCKPMQGYKIRWFSGQILKCDIRESDHFMKNRNLELHVSSNYNIIQKVESANGKLEDLVTINRGVNVGGCFEHFVSSTKISKDYYKYLSGTRSISRYEYKWSLEHDGFFVFDSEKETLLRNQGKTMVLGNPDRFLQDRLFIPESGKTLMCAYASERIYSAYGIMVATAKSTELNLKYACALLNSRLLNYYAIEKEILRKGNKATPHVGVKGLNSIPVWLGPELVRRRIARLVDEILSMKQGRPSADTSRLEREIDNQVYALYGLAAEEIAIVERASP